MVSSFSEFPRKYDKYTFFVRKWFVYKKGNVHILCQQPRGGGMENLTKVDARGGGSGYELTSACVRISF